MYVLAALEPHRHQLQIMYTTSALRHCSVFTPCVVCCGVVSVHVCFAHLSSFGHVYFV